MAISPVNVTRISQNYQTNFVLEAIRHSQRRLLATEEQIATGRTFVRPSDDPIAASRTLQMTQALARQDQYRANAEYGDKFLAAADSALTEINSLLIQASQIAIQTVGSLTTADEREAEAEVVAGIREQLLRVGNRQFNGRYLFGGREVLRTPFVERLGGIDYVGDFFSLITRLSERESVAISMPGSTLFGAISRRIGDEVDLTPRLDRDTRLEDIWGGRDGVFLPGRIVFHEVGGAGEFGVDLAGAATLGEAIDLINEAASTAGSELTAALSETGIVITPGAFALSVTDDDGGSTATALGLLQVSPTREVIEGTGLRTRISRLTPVEALNGGAGIDLESGFVITTDSTSVTVDVSEAKTVQDIINTINNSGVGVIARINELGTGIEVFNTVSGTTLTIGENGGTTAADLGIRTMDEETPLSELNFGEGVLNAEGLPDFRITTKDGDTLDVDLDGVGTIRELIERINEAATEAGISIRASLAEVGNGILLEDNTGGSGELTVAAVNTDAAEDLGILQTVSGEESILIGRDVNPTRTEGILGALFDLERALRNDDTRGISAAGERLDGLRNEVTRIHGIIGARSQAMTSKKNQIDAAVHATEVFLSEIRDLDYAEAITRLNSTTTTMQASLQTSAMILNLSLMDFLG